MRVRVFFFVKNVYQNLRENLHSIISSNSNLIHNVTIPKRVFYDFRLTESYLHLDFLTVPSSSRFLRNHEQDLSSCFARISDRQHESKLVFPSAGGGNTMHASCEPDIREASSDFDFISYYSKYK